MTTHRPGEGPEPSVSAPVVTFDLADGTSTRAERRVATEVAVQVAFAEVPFGVMMMTPADLEDFALGFSLTEGVIETARDVRGVRVEPEGDALRLRIDLAPSRLHAHLARRRAMTGRTGCGLCGIDDPASLPRAREQGGAAPRIALDAIGRALAGLDGLQVLNRETRAVHGAAWASLDGQVTLVREDVGRHNALDKLVGALLRGGIEPGQGFILVTSRASFEMVEKAATFGCRTLVAVSAPTALAIERARRLDVTLLGIARRDAVSVFHGAERIVA